MLRGFSSKDSFSGSGFSSDELEFQTTNDQTHRPRHLSTTKEPSLFRQPLTQLNRTHDQPDGCDDDDDGGNDDDDFSRTWTHCSRFSRTVCTRQQQQQQQQKQQQQLNDRRQSSHCTRIVQRAVAVFGILSFISFVDLTSSSPLFYCHRLDPAPRRLYATKTSYDDVRSLQEEAAAVEEVEVQSTWKKADDSSTCDEREDKQASAGDFDGRTKQPVNCGGWTAAATAAQLERIRNESVANGLLRCLDSSKVSTEVNEDCQPSSVYILARHGTRYNKLSNMDGMAERLNRIKALVDSHSSKGTMCDEDLNWLRSWKPRHSIEDDSKLSNTGWNELLRIGQRFGDQFPKVLRRNYSPSLYEFRYTNYTGKGDRTRQSARAFAKGLWDRFENVEMIENPRPDWLLQFYEHCHKYLRVVGGQPVEDYEKFKSGPEMMKVIGDVNRRLGLQENTIGFSDVYLMFENCRLEHGLYRDAPWCSVLTPAMLEVIEYHQDIKYYWEDGYGHRISYEPACTLIDDILRHLQDDSKLGRFRFAHSGTLDSFYTRIGLFEDEEPLRANNFDRHRASRRWTTSRSTPMAANIAFVKHSCLHPPHLRVMTFVNENLRHPVTIPGCPSALCPIETVGALWRPIADSCDIERICEQQQSSRGPVQETTRTRNQQGSSDADTDSAAAKADILPLR